MIGSPHRRITLLHRREMVRLVHGRRVRTGASEREMRVLFTRLAEECERGSTLTLLLPAAGVFGADDEDPWVAAPPGR